MKRRWGLRALLACVGLAVASVSGTAQEARPESARVRTWDGESWSLGPSEPAADTAPKRSSLVGQGARGSIAIRTGLWLASPTGDVQAGQFAGSRLEVDLGDTLEDFQSGGTLRLEAHHRRGWGLLFDYSSVDFERDPTSPGPTVGDGDLRQRTVEALLVRRFRSEGGAEWDLLAGARWWGVDLDLELSPGAVRRSRNVTWVDPVVGLRFSSRPRGEWGLFLRGDVGGFGVHSDFSWSASAGARVPLGRSLTVELAYRALAVDYEESGFSYDTLSHGPSLGLSFAR